MIEDHRSDLCGIVRRLQGAWPDRISRNLIKKETKKLAKIHKIRFRKNRWAVLPNSTYKFSSGKFPGIPKENFKLIQDTAPDLEEREKFRPETLAEALLWKMGNWGKYRNFVKDFANEPDAANRESGVVFYGFTKHLKEYEKIPIFDQHSARALWVISDKIWDIPGSPFLNYLLEQSDENGNRKWKVPSGKKVANTCWSEYAKELGTIAEQKGIDLDIVDKLLMPLGQALKAYARYVNDDCHFSGVSSFRE